MRGRTGDTVHRTELRDNLVTIAGAGTDTHRSVKRLCRFRQLPFGLIELDVASAQGRDQQWHTTMPDNLSEATLGLEYSGRGPAQHHRSALPAFYSTTDLAHTAEQIFDQVGGRQHSFEILRELQAHHG